ncbi:MAG: tetratricopeptide repeat protein [Methylococcaceae bacterium]|nr:tetratricopeptide repeat protein [Methylococcaceae bacterium]
MTAVNDLVIQAVGLQNQGQEAAATELFDSVLNEDPRNAAALYSLGLIALNRGELAKALEYSERGCEAAPNFPPLWFLHASVLQATGHPLQALTSYDNALKLQPDFVPVLINSGALLRELHRHSEALDRFLRVLAIEPNHPGALANSAILLTEFKQSERAISFFERLLALHPDYDYGLGLLLYERLHIGDWDGFDTLREAILAGVRAGKRVCKSLAFMAISGEVSEHYCCTRIFAHHFAPLAGKPLWTGERYNHQRIRLAYVSPDLREHPVGHLMAGVFERHDKSRFETIAISLGINDGSRLRARMEAAFDHFIDAQNMGARRIAELMREMEVDVAIDLAGYTSDSRVEVFSHRPAPVHANFLGYPGTLGVNYMDYLIADRHVIPPEHQPFYSETVMYLPDCYLPVDIGIQIADRTPTREECGLPQTGPVLCSFSHDYKITPPLWAAWMRVLQRIPASVLWLACRNESTQRNYRKAAQTAGVDPNRLVFAARLPRVEDHLARYRLADVFLDTWPYNAHSTAADALLVGLPVVTFMGNAFPARVAASLLGAAGLPELVTSSWEAYEDLVVNLATDAVALGRIKAKLAANRERAPLFDTSRFTANLEKIAEEMLNRRLAMS